MRAARAMSPLLIVVSTCASASADEPVWVDRPLVLGPFRASLEAGIASGAVPGTDGTARGTGASFEGAIGLPLLCELRLRAGYRVNDAARAAGADQLARPFDHEMANEGLARWANPEAMLRYAFLDLDGFALALETRFVLPSAEGTHFRVAPGLPMRISLPGMLRVDTGVYVPFRSVPDAQYSISVPLHSWFQVSSFFFGPMAGARLHHLVTATGTHNRVDLSAGVGLGYTFLGRMDVKAQLYSARINDKDWAKTVGAGGALSVTLF